MKKQLWLLSALLGLALALPAQPLAEAAPESVQMSSERLQRIGQVLQEYVDSSYIPGAVALVARHGKIVYHQAFGYADVDSRQPLQRDHI
ncbi:serine hydrolase, partial [Arthrospira platensis SPKY1]|nr:serine hydrolase [Arthrospira platensis SPKY1]